MPRIFISYRRDDSSGHAGRLYDHLTDHFGQGQVFMDVDAIKPGLNFVEVVQQAVSVCEGLVAVIGREWLETSDRAGGRRLDDGEDLVRVEIATALERGIRVIPVLVQGAQMPRGTDLPDVLRDLASRNALELSDARFRSDVERLIEALEAPTEDPLADSVFVEPAQLASSTFVGRDREMGELNTALEETLAGQGRMVMLVGEPGIGKTRTAQEFASYARTRGAQVLWGRCFEEEGTPPYWPWVQPIRSYVQQTNAEQLQSEMGPGAADVAGIVPELREKLPGLEPPPALDPEQARFRLFDSITSFFKNAAQSRPTMLVLDDLHWADKPSLLLLQFLAREMAGSRLLVVGTYRDVELSRRHPLLETLAQLSREPVFRRELLSGLSQEDSGRFIEATAGIHPTQQFVETLYTHTEGNPFFLSEVIQLLADRGELTADDIGGRQGIKIPEGVREVIGQRLNRLSDQCNQALTTASFIGREFDFRLLAALSAGITEDQLLGAIDEAVSARLIEALSERIEGYRFSHALIQQTLSEELIPSRRVRLHARIGQALEELYGFDVEAHAAELAHHFAEAEPVIGTEKLVRYSRPAGEQALAAYAYEEALSHFRRALDARESEPMDAATADLWFGLGRAQAALQSEDAFTSLTRAFDFYVDSADVSKAVAVAESPDYGTDLQLTGVDRLISRALTLVPPDSHEAGRMLSRYGQVIGLQGSDYEEARDAFDRALAIARREEDPGLEMRTLAAAAAVDSNHMRYREALENSLKAIQLVDRVDGPRAEAAARYFAVTALTITGDLEGARPHAAAMLTAAERLRDRFWLRGALWKNQIVYRLAGDWRIARDLANRGLTIASDQRLLLGDLVMLEHEVGNIAEGEACLLQLRSSTRQLLDHGNDAMVTALVARITGVPDQLDVAESTAKTVLATPSATPAATERARTGLALVAAQRGDISGAEEYYAAMEPRRGTMLFWAISADRLLALLSVTMGDLDLAATHFEDALSFCRKAGYLPELAWACHDSADALLQRGGPSSREKAVSLLDEALSISTELGMLPLKQRVTERLERVHARPGPVPAYPDGLTQREVEVLRLIAAGKTDREIAEELVIGVRTVTTHVGNILNKTNAANRAEAASYATRNGLA